MNVVITAIKQLQTSKEKMYAHFTKYMSMFTDIPLIFSVLHVHPSFLKAITIPTKRSP